VLSGLLAGLGRPGFWRALRAFAADLSREFTRNRFRRFGQALVLAREWPDGGEWLHAHFIHTPASATRYASLVLGIPWTCSAHCQGHLDLRRLGAPGKACVGALDRDLHRLGFCASA